MHRRSLPFRHAAALLGGLGLAACGPESVATTLPTEPTPAITQLVVAPAADTLAFLGDETRLTATLRNALGQPVTAPRIYWESLDPTVATVDTTGRVTAVAVGSTFVRAQFLELADTMALTVRRIPVSMSLSADTLLFTELGRSLTVGATVRDGSGAAIPTPAISWSSDEPAVASVDATGKVKSLNDGVTTLNVRADTVARTIRVRVASRAASMTVTPTSVRMDGISDTSRVVTVLRDAAGVSMYPKVPTYTSSDTTVVTVDFIGFLIARKAGTAVITVKADTLTRTVPVTVTQTIHSVRIYPDTATVAVGAGRSLAALVQDRFGHAVAGASVTWSSSDAAVASVSAAGVVTGVAPGQITLTAVSGGKSDTATVTVVAGAGGESDR